MTDAEQVKASIAGVFDRTAADYEQVGVSHFAPMGRTLVDRAGVRAGRRVLDVGCGRGHCLFPAAAAVGPSGRVVGTDLAPRMVELCRREAAERGLAQVHVEVGDAAAPAFTDGSFDVVTAGFVVFFLPDPHAALGAYARLLRPGGWLAMSTFGPPDPAFEATMKTLDGYRDPDPDPNPDPDPASGADWPFASPQTISAMVAAAGFEQVRVEEVAHDTTFTDLDQFWTWMWSHGPRLLLDQLPPDRVPQAQAAADQHLRTVLDCDGALVTRSLQWITTALAPPAA